MCDPEAVFIVHFKFDISKPKKMGPAGLNKEVTESDVFQFVIRATQDKAFGRRSDGVVPFEFANVDWTTHSRIPEEPS